jgi:hypothetical protein
MAAELGRIGQNWEQEEQGAVEAPVDDFALKADREEAVADMWAWFNDWSVTAEDKKLTRLSRSK